MSLSEQLKRMQEMASLGYDGYFAQKNAAQAKINDAYRERNDAMTRALTALPESPPAAPTLPEPPLIEPLTMSESQYQAMLAAQDAPDAAVDPSQKKQIWMYEDADYGIDRSRLPFETITTTAAKALNWASDNDYETAKEIVTAARDVGAIPDTAIRAVTGDEKAIESLKSGLANIDDHVAVGAHGIKRAWNDRQTEAVKNAVKDALRADLREMTLQGLYQSPQHKALRETIFDFDWQWENFIRDAQRGAVDIGAADPEEYFNEQQGQGWWQRTVGDITGRDFRALNARMKTAFENYVKNGNTAGRTLIPAIDDKGKVLVENRVKLRDYEDAAQAARDAEAAIAKMGQNPNEGDYRYDAAFKLGDGIASSAPALAAGAGTMALTRNPITSGRVAAAFMSAPVAGRAYHDARVAGASPNRATVYAAIYAAAEYLPEKVALGKFFSGMGQKWYRQVLRQAGVEFLQEGITETAQLLADKGVLHQDIGLGEAIHRIAEAAVLGGTIGGLMGGGSAAIGAAAQRVSRNGRQDDSQNGNPAAAPPAAPNNGAAAANGAVPNPVTNPAPSSNDSNTHDGESSQSTAVQPLLSAEEMAALRKVNPIDAATIELMQNRLANEPNMSAQRRDTLDRQLQSIRDRHSEAIAKEIQAAMAADIETKGLHYESMEDFLDNAQQTPEILPDVPAANTPELDIDSLPQELQMFFSDADADAGAEQMNAQDAEQMIVPSAQIQPQAQMNLEPDTQTLVPSPNLEPLGVQEDLAVAAPHRQEGFVPLPPPPPSLEEMLHARGIALPEPTAAYQGQESDVADVDSSRTQIEDADGFASIPKIEAVDNQEVAQPAEPAPQSQDLTDEEMQAQYRPLLNALLGREASALVVLANRLPNQQEIMAEGVFYQGQVYLNANRVNEYALEGNVLLTAEQRLAWVAWHELFHRGLSHAQAWSLRGEKPFAHLLRDARKNAFVAQLSQAIIQERKAQAAAGLAPEGALIHSEDVATEEALAEIAAAMHSDKMNALIARYQPFNPRLKTPPTFKSVDNLIERLIAIMRRVLSYVARGGKAIETASDEEIIQALRTVLAFNFDSLVPQESDLPHPNAPLDKSNPRLNLYDAPVNAYDAHDDAGKESPLKKAFTNNAKMFLEAVEKHLAQAGFAPIPSKRKSKKAKAVSLNWGGVAVSGDVSLRMQDADGLQIYATINADSLMGGGDYYTNLMYRLENMPDGQTLGSNHWYPLGENNNTAQQVAEAMLEMYRTYQQPNSNKGQANATLEESATEDENNGRAEQYQNADEAGVVPPVSDSGTEVERAGFGSDAANGGGDLGGGHQFLSGVRDRTGHERERGDDVGERLHETGVSGSGRDLSVHDGDAAGDGLAQQAAQEGIPDAPSFDELAAQEESRELSGADTDAVPDFSKPARPSEPVVGENHRINPADLLAQGDWFARAQANVEAIRLAKRLKAENALPNEEQRKALARFTGWGASAFNKLFDERRQPVIWKALNAQLREVTTQEEYDYILRSTQYAHYTSPEIVQAIYQGLARLGFNGGRVLEPASGVGIFNGLMPDEMARSSRYTGVEIDGITGLIAQLLYPQSDMRIADFTQFQIPRKAPKYDAVVGNPPFADIVVKNAVAHKDARLHDYFFLRGMDALREGGVMAFVTSTGTMDKSGEKVRAKLAEHADLLAAFRLPNTAFADAGTEAVTDIIFLQKRRKGQESKGEDWRSVKPVRIDGQNFALNEYYHRHPSHILGDLQAVSSAHGAKMTVAGKGRDLSELLTEAIQSLPQHVFEAAEGSLAQEAEVLAADFAPTTEQNAPMRLGSVFVQDGNLMRVNEYGEALPLTHRYSNGKEIALKESEKGFLKDYVVLRDAVLQAQREQLSAKPEETYWQNALQDLQKIYRNFVKKHGRLLDFTEHERIAKVKQEDGETVEEAVVSTRHKNRHLLNLDAQSFVISAIEKVTPERSKKGEAVIVDGAFLGDERTLNAPVEPVIENAFDAMMVAMNEHGKTDVARAAQLLGSSEAQIVAELGDRIFQNPHDEEQGQSAKWIFADEYLTGDVVQKLKDAKAKAKDNADFARNVAALEAVIPAPIPANEIAMRFGANWIPQDVYQDFIAQVLQSATMKFHYHKPTGQWTVAGSHIGDAELRSEHFKDNDFLEKILNAKEIAVRRKAEDDSYYIDVDATSAANLKADLIRERFSAWALEDAARAERLAEIYNDRFNNIVPPQYDGAHLRLVGASHKVELRPHQKDAVYRIIRSGDTYLNHTVGAGKTFTMIAAAMEERRLGLIKKPMFVVPNHMLMQFSNEFLQLYPSADLMIADEENFAAHNRKMFVAQAAMNNPDAIIITHSAFSRIAVSEETQREFIQDEIHALIDTIDTIAALEGKRSMSVKQWQKVKQKKEEQLKALLSAQKKDNQISFEELGVDRLYIDEAHEFRKLSFSTAMNRIRGIDPNGSQKAADLAMKLRDLRRNNHDSRRAVVFASGTPVTNTMGELFTVLRYFRPDVLERDDTSFFDAWARQFGEVVEDVEMDASGDYKAVKRFAKFVNIPELMRRVLDFMDVVSSQDLSAYVSRPEIKGGERQIVITEESEQFKGFQNILRDRMAKIKNRGGKPEKGADIMLNVIGDGRLGALDLRFIDNTLPPDYDNKVNRLIADVAQAYKESADFEYFDDSGKVEPIKGAAIVVFSDLGFGKAVAQSRGFDLRKWTFDELLRLGVDKNHIAFIDDFNTNAKKRALFEDMKQGRKRILIGGKGMETGMNIQKRLKYLFHLDAPWFPSSMEQREGRIIRQGNQNKQVDIRAYATYGSYDSAMWATLARKARFIEQIFSGDFSQRSMEDVGQSSQFEEAAAMVSSDPNAQRLNELKKRVDKLEREERGYFDEQRRQKMRIKEVRGQIDWANGRLTAIAEALKIYQPLDAERFSGIVLGKKYHKRSDFGTALMAAFDKRRIGASDVQKLAEVGGYDIQLRLTSDGRAFLDIAIPYKNVEPLIAPDAFEKATPSGLPTKIENRISDLPAYQESVQAMLAKSERDLASLLAVQGKPFPRAEELAQARQDLSVFEQEITNAAKSVQEAAVQEAKEQEQYSISPMKSVQANIARGREAMNRAIVGKTDVHRAMYRQGLGWVDFVWGDVGVLLPSGKTKRAMGIAHIIESRMRKDDMNYGEAVQMLTERVVNTIAKGEESRIYESNDGKNKSVFIEHDGNRATLVQRKGSNVWLMNAFELHPTDEQGVSNDTVLPTQSKPTRQRHGLGAVGENSLNPNAAAVNPVSPLGTEIRGAEFQTDERGDVLYSIAPSALLENARPRRSAKSFDEVRTIVSEMVGKPLSNKATGMVATISKRSLDKLISGKAANKSSSRKDHIAAAANIDQLFENAILGWTEPHKTDTTNIAGVHKMFAPLQVDGAMRLTKLTVKEMAFNQGNRIYSVEAIEVENENSGLSIQQAATDGAMPEMTEVDTENSNSAPSRLHSANVQSLIQAIEDFNRSSRLQAPAGTRLDDGEFQTDDSGDVLYSIAPIDYVRTKVLRHEIFTSEGFKRLMLDRMRELERIREVLDDERMDDVVHAFRGFNGRVNHELERDVNPRLEHWADVLADKAVALRRDIPKYRGMSRAAAVAQLMTDLDVIISFVLHGEERNMVIAARLQAQGKKLDKEDYAGSGKTDDEIAALRGMYESGDFGNGALIEYAKEFYASEILPLLEESKQKLRNAGLLTPEMEQKFPTYEYYVPLYGAPTMEEQIEQAIIRDYAPRLSDEALKNTTYAAKGRRGTKAHSIFETLITQAKIAANRSQMQRNKERLWGLLSDSAHARDEFDAKLSVHHAKDVEVDLVDEYGEAEHIVIRQDDKHEGSNLRQIVWQQGNVFYVMEIGNMRALDAIRNINRNPVKNSIIRGVQAVTRWSAAWFTAKNITWQPVNKIRDSADMFHYLFVDAPLGDMSDMQRMGVALKAAWLNTRYTTTGGWDNGFKYWLEEYASLGGVTSYNQLLGMNQLEELQKLTQRKAKGYSLNAYRVYGHLMGRLSMFLEMTTRVSAYRALVEAGVGQEAAAMYVKNVMNFETKGDLAANMGAFYMFFTSAIYGSARLLSSLKTRRGWISLAMLTAFSLALKQVIRGLLPKDDEGKTCLDRYDAVSATNFVIFPVFSDDGVMRCEGIRTPVGFGFGRISNGFAAGLDRLIHGADAGDFVSDMVNGVIVNGLAPISPTARSWSDDPTGALFDTFAPSVAKPLLQFTDNKNFRGSRIYDDSPYRAVGELDYNSGFDGTRDSDKALARWIYDTVGWDIHPETIAHFGRSYMNGIYEPVMDAAEIVIDQSGEGRLGIGSDLSHMPFVNRFRQKAPSDLATDYFRERDEAKDTFNRHADAAMRGKAFTHEKQQAAVKSQANAMLFKAADAALKKVRQERKSMREQAQLAKDAAREELRGDALKERLRQINQHQQTAERRYHDAINNIYRQAVKQLGGLND